MFQASVLTCVRLASVLLLPTCNDAIGILATCIRFEISVDGASLASCARSDSTHP